MKNILNGKVLIAMLAIAAALVLAGCLPVTSKTPVGTTAGLGADEALFPSRRGARLSPDAEFQTGDMAGQGGPSLPIAGAYVGHLNNSGELVRLVEDVGPDIAGICVDTANVLCHSEDPLLAARRAAPYTHLTHTKDAILYLSDPGHPKEPEWPAVDFIVSNPPFLGDKLMRSGLGDDYVDKLRALYKDRVPGGADLCCYWFEKARKHVVAKGCRRAGLLLSRRDRTSWPAGLLLAGGARRSDGAVDQTPAVQ